MKGMWFKIKEVYKSRALNEAGNLSFLSRLAILFIFLLLACLVTLCLFSLFLTYSSTLSNTLEKAFGGSSNANFFLSSSLLLVFGLVFGFGNWIIKTHDKKKEFSDTFNQKNEVLFSESIKLFSQEDKKQKKIGLMQLVNLKKVGFVEAERIDLLITGKGDLRDGNLESAHLEGIDLSSMDLRGANLKGAKLTGANLQKVEFHNANLSGASLQKVKFYHADLREANLTEANLTEANLFAANLSGANLQKVKFYNANLSRANLTEANLQKVKFYKAGLREANLTEANLTEANIFDVDMKEANLRGANLRGAKLQEVKFHNTDLRGANLEEVKGLQDNCLVGAKIDKETKFSEGIDIKKLGATYEN